MTSFSLRRIGACSLLTAVLSTSACLDFDGADNDPGEDVAASAAALTSGRVCATIRFFDTREDRSDRFRSKLTWDDHNENAPVSDLTVYVMDQDGSCRDAADGCSETNDDQLAVAVTDTNGRFCVSGITSDQDVYFLTRYEGHDVRVMTDTGDPATAVSYTRWNIGGDLDADWNITCYDDDRNAVDGRCNQTATGESVEATYLFPLHRAYANILVTMNQGTRQLSDATRHINGHTNTFTVYYPDFPSGMSGDCRIQHAQAVGFDRMCVGPGYANNNHAVLHELGHNIHRRALDYSGSLSGGTCGSTVNWEVSGSQKCAVSEGWADFFAGALSWHPNATAPWSDPRSTSNTDQLLEGATIRGNNQTSACVSMNSSPELAPGNVARWFWDLYDDTNLVDNYGSYDNARYKLSELVAIWGEFEPGLFDRQNNELFQFGRNAWDYAHYDGGVVSELRLNCLEDHQR